MHYATLASVEIPHIKEEEELNAIIAVAENTLEAQSDSDFMNEYFLRKIQSLRTSFSRAVSKAVDEVMDPFVKTQMILSTLNLMIIPMRSKICMIQIPVHVSAFLKEELYLRDHMSSVPNSL